MGRAGIRTLRDGMQRLRPGHYSGAGLTDNAVAEHGAGHGDRRNSDVSITVTARKDGYTSVSVDGSPSFGWDLDFKLTRR